MTRPTSQPLPNLLLSAMVSTCLVAPSLASQGDAASSGTPAAKAAGAPDKPVKKDGSAWKRLRERLDAASEAELSRLRGLLESKLADLGLDFASPDNRDYLLREFDKIAELEPDIPAALVELLAPAKDTGSARNRADNARRILMRFDLAPFAQRLRKLCDDAPTMRGRLRALRLLCRTRHPERLRLLDGAIKNTPEVYVPALLAAIGDSGQPALAERVHSFLARPNEAQRYAALAALARLANPSSISPATKAAVELASVQSFASLLNLLANTQARLSPGFRAPFAQALEEILRRAENLDKAQATRALELAASLPTAGLGAMADKLSEALLKLSEHPSTDVQLRSARILLDRGDKRAVKQILDRLGTFVKNNKKVPYAWQQRALAHRAFGNPKAALKDINQAIRLSPTSDPRLHFLAAELEIARKATSAILRHLKATEASPEELARFRKRHPALEPLLGRNRQLRRLFGEK